MILKSLKEVIDDNGGTKHWAKCLGLHPSTIRRWIANNDIPTGYEHHISVCVGVHLDDPHIRYKEELVERREKERKSESKRFILQRLKDLSGISGTGIVAEGIQFTNGICVINWLSKFTSQTIFSDLQTLIDIHGHDGATQVKFLD